MGNPKLFEEIKGKKFLVMGNRNSHNYPTGRILTFKRNFTDDTGLDMAIEKDGGNNISRKNCFLVCTTTYEILQSIDDDERLIERIVHNMSSKLELAMALEEQGKRDFSKDHSMLIDINEQLNLSEDELF